MCATPGPLMFSTKDCSCYSALLNKMTTVPIYRKKIVTTFTLVQIQSNFTLFSLRILPFPKIAQIVQQATRAYKSKKNKLKTSSSEPLVQIQDSFYTNNSHKALYQNNTNCSIRLNKMASRVKNRKSLKQYLFFGPSVKSV